MKKFKIQSKICYDRIFLFLSSVEQREYKHSMIFNGYWQGCF
jgi:hypothetical protein